MAHIRFILPPLKCHLSFFGFLIIGELTCDSHLNPERHSTVPDLVFVPKSSPKFKLVGLKVFKTDPFRKGQTTVIEKANSNLCLTSAMLTYLESRTLFPTSVPPFSFNLVSPLFGADYPAKPGSYFQREGLIQVNLLVTVFA